MGIEGVVLDVDGTLVRGEEPIAGAAEGVAAIREAGLSLVCFSNNPTAPPEAYVDRLGRAGIDVTASEVLTSGVVTADYLAAEHPDETAYVVGEPGLVDLIEDRDVRTTSDPASAAVVVGSIDRSFDYEALTDALRALSGDVPFLGTDPDRTIPVADGRRPGSGAILAALSAVAERDPDRTLGKPADTAREAACERLDCDPAECLVVGDRLDTDVALGAAAGMTTVLVSTGVTDTRSREEFAPRPDYVVESLAGVREVIDEVDPRRK